MKAKIDQIKNSILRKISSAENKESIQNLTPLIFGKKGMFSEILALLSRTPKEDKSRIGKIVNEIKKEVTEKIAERYSIFSSDTRTELKDVTVPGMRPEIGSLHLVTSAINEISSVFEKIGFTRMRYPEIEWEYYAFDALNMPKNHPARDDFETFFVDAKPHDFFGKMVLSPHTSSGQVREMERVKNPPIRMINISKCYRPNYDVSHTPMFHQFEGLVVDRGINITHLKGTMDYFAGQFFGPDRKTRLRPFHFQFTEPSFEVDITCGVCQGKAVLENGDRCRLCKEGWLELGGSGMVHPNVLKAGKIDPDEYSGFAFGWGIERTFMMKSGTKLDDIRHLYTNDIRFLKQF